jgi:DNA segregation ATPase FtsK/SpoIIIE-like protein
VADEFDIPLEIAEKLVERDKAIKENPLEAMTETSGKLFAGISAILGKPEKSELYDKAFEFVASSGNEEPEALAEALEITVEQAVALIEEMRLHGDIASEDDGEEESEETSNDESEDFDDDSDDDSEPDLSDFPEKVIEALSFVGDMIQNTSEKICDILDESVEKLQEHDFDF